MNKSRKRGSISRQGDQKLQSTMVENRIERRCKYWATRSSFRSFARTAHSFACSGLLALLARSAGLTRSLAHFAHSLARGKVNYQMAIFSVFFFHFRPQCISVVFRPISGAFPAFPFSQIFNSLTITLTSLFFEHFEWPMGAVLQFVALKLEHRLIFFVK